VLESGRLIEEVTGEELSARNGLLAKLYKIQLESMGWTTGR
jgi:ABC-type multidrug transport system fused ATPase/permease subunit